MGMFSLVKTVVKPFVDFPTWMGYKQIKEQTKGLWGVIKGLFVPGKPDTTESFAEALKRLNITEEGLLIRKKRFMLMMFLWVAIAILILVYAIYLAGLHSWHGFISCVAISLIAWVYAFRYNFWVFQIKQRRLGCTFRDWLNGTVTGDQL